MTNKYQVESFAQTASVVQTDLVHAVSHMANGFKSICDQVADGAVDSLVVTAVAKIGGAEIKVTEIVYDRDEGHRTSVINTGWKHRLPESAMDTFGTLSDAIAILSEENDDEFTTALDIGSTPIGTFTTSSESEITSDDDTDDE